MTTRPTPGIVVVEKTTHPSGLFTEGRARLLVIREKVRAGGAELASEFVGEVLHVVMVPSSAGF